MTKNTYFSLLAHTLQLLLMTFLIRMEELKVVFGHMETRTDGQTDVAVEIVT